MMGESWLELLTTISNFVYFPRLYDVKGKCLCMHVFEYKSALVLLLRCGLAAHMAPRVAQNMA